MSTFCEMFRRKKYIRILLETRNNSTDCVVTVLAPQNNTQQLKLTARLFPDWFHAIKILHLNANRLHALDRNTFEKLETLTQLCLDQNRLDSLPDKLFTPCPRLQKLYLQNNRFQITPRVSLQQLTRSLIELDLSGNLLQAFADFELCSLQILNLKNNRIDRFANNTLPSLRQLDVSCNCLQRIDVVTMARSRQLERCDFALNRIDAINGGTFYAHEHLKYLILNNNRLTKFAGMVFHRKCRLVELQLANNHLIWIDANGLHALKSFRVDNNYLLTWATNWHTIGELRHLFLNGVVLCQQQLPVLEHSGKLTRLEMCDSVFETIPEHYFGVLTRLESLRLNGSRAASLRELNGVLFGERNRLRRLWLSDCCIRTIGPYCFRHLVFLTILDLSMNWIRVLNAGTFHSLSGLQSLNLRANRLHALDKDIFAKMGELREIDLTLNCVFSVSRLVFSRNLKLVWKCLDPWVTVD